MANLHVEESPLARHVQGEHVMASIMSSRLAAELDHAFERNGWSPQEVKLLSSGSLLAGVHKMMFGQPKTTKHIIDCDVAPSVLSGHRDTSADTFIHDGWEIEEHQKGGQFSFDATQVQLFLAEGQQNGNFMEGYELRKELAGKPVLNANVLDYLLAHPELIPEEWKGKLIFFWGTVYRDSGEDLYVRYLNWTGGGSSGRWNWDGLCCVARLRRNCPAALRIG